MRRTFSGTIVIVAATLLSAAATTLTPGSLSPPAVMGRLAYMPHTVQKEISANGGQFDLAYLKLPSGEAVKIRFGHPRLGRYLDTPKWSPDGSRILLVGQRADAPTRGKQGEAKSIPWVLDLKTNNLQPVAQPSDRDCLSADWLPDGRRIVLWTRVGKNLEVAVMTGAGPVLRGGNSRLIVVNLRSKREKTVWRSIYPYRYVRSPARSEFLIWERDYRLVSANRRTAWKIKGFGMPDCMEFSPDGRKIAIYANYKLHIVDRNTGTRRTIYTKGKGSAHELAWSPDGRWIAFREGWVEGSFDPPAPDFLWDVLAVDVETRKVHEFPDRVYMQGKYDYTPTVLGWTKDSKNLALSVPEPTGRPHPDAVRQHLVLCPLTGGKGIRVADITSLSDALVWLPR